MDIVQLDSKKRKRKRKKNRKNSGGGGLGGLKCGVGAACSIASPYEGIVGCSRNFGGSEKSGALSSYVEGLGGTTGVGAGGVGVGLGAGAGVGVVVVGDDDVGVGGVGLGDITDVGGGEE